MPIVINQLMLDELVYDIKEIRVRTLHDIENKLRSALWDNADIVFNAPALFKNLIRWFGQVPICEEVTVLETMSLLLSKKYGAEIVQFFTRDRIIKELNKIRYLIGSNPELDELVTFLVKQLDELKTSPVENVPIVELTDVESSMAQLDLACADTAHTRQSIMDSITLRWKDDPTFYTECWEKPSQDVASWLESFNDILLRHEDETNLNIALAHVIRYTKEYPAEFFLRPPYICLSLFHTIKIRKVSIRTGFQILLHLLRSIQKRARQRCLVAMYMPAESINKNEKNQISTAAFAFELFQLGIEQLKELSTEMDLLSSNMILAVLAQITTVLWDGAFSLLENLQPKRFFELRSDMGYLLKQFRQEWESNSTNTAARTRYRMILKILLECLNHWKLKHADNCNDSPIEHYSTDSQAAGEYNPSDFATMNSTGHQRLLEETDDTWLHELHLALLDYPLMKACPLMYRTFLNFMCKEDLRNNHKMNVLADISDLFETVVELLRGGTNTANIPDEEMLTIAPDIINTLFLHRSFDLMRMVMSAVEKCASSVTEDGPLWDAIESIMIRLLSDRDEEIRSEVYVICTNMMKDFIGQLDEGAILTRRSLFSQNSPKLRALGIPLSLQIITEITCFGYTSSNSKIRQCAETMLLFLCNSKAFLLEKWTDVQEILLPIASLLQTAVIGLEETKLRKVVMGLFHPDFGLPWLDNLQGNLRLLFHEESTIREEALTRVLFLISSIDQPEQLSPRIDQIGDTIPNGVCLVKLPYDPRRQQMVDVYDVSAVRPLLDTLEQQDGDPALRRSTLTQLNIMAEDPVLCDLIHNASGWVQVLKSLYNALRDDHFIDYPDAAIPAVGILNKLCFNVITFRRFLGTNANAFHLIVRALFCFHHMPAFLVECCSLLYLLLFADCSTGVGPMVSLPTMCSSSAFRIPFVCQFHWRHSPFQQLNMLELIIQCQSVDGQVLQLDGDDGSVLRGNEKTLMQQAPRGDDGIESSLACYKAHSSMYPESLMRYIRFMFADIWFGGIHNILKAYDPKQMKSSENELAPMEYKRKESEAPAIRFNPALRLTKQDLHWLNLVDAAFIFRKGTRRIATAKGHADVYDGLAMLEGNTFLTVECVILVDQQTIIDSLKRYFHSPPATTTDQQLLVEVFSIVGNLIDLGLSKLRNWVIEMLSCDGNLFGQLLRTKTCPVALYTKTIDLLQVTLLSVQRSENRADGKMPSAEVQPADCRQQRGKATVADIAWDTRLFQMVGKQLEIELVEARNITYGMLLAELLQRLAVRVDIERVAIVDIIPKLLVYIKGIRSTSYNGSTIVRSCLITIRELLGRIPKKEETIVLNMKPCYYKLLSTQCGHSCPQIRACAWNVLARFGHSLSAAEHIVQECAYLPGGIHASCISTLLDPREACLVKESAAGLLVVLLSHCSDKDGLLRQSMLPLHCAPPAGRTEPIVKISTPLDAVLLLLSKQSFFEHAAKSMIYYTPIEYLAFGELVAPSTNTLVSADLVKGYAYLYRSLFALGPGGLERLFSITGFLQSLLDCVTRHPSEKPSIPELLMVSEICLLLLRQMKEANHDSVLQLLTANQSFFDRILLLLQPTFNDQYRLKRIAMRRTAVHIMQLLSMLTMTPTGKQQISFAVRHLNVQPIAQLIEEGVCSRVEDYQLTSLSFLSIFVHCLTTYTSDASDSSFLLQLENVVMPATEVEPAMLPSCGPEDSEEEQNKTKPIDTLGNEQVESRSARAHRSGTGRIFTMLLLQFHRCLSFETTDVCFKPGQKRSLYTAMQIMLCASSHCRLVGWEAGLLSVIIQRLNDIHDSVLGRLSYAEFVRKNGDGKKTYIVTELMELLKLVSCWFSATDDVLNLKQDQINTICRIVLLYWPWVKSNHALELMFLEALIFLTESSIIVCKTLVSTFTGHPNSIMKLLVVTLSTETARAKGPKHDLRVLSMGLRVLMNCSCCQVGRSAIGKLNVLDNISKLHPSVTKLHKPWVEITRLWLEFWDFYTQFEDVCEVRHLTVLGALMRRSDHNLRSYALAIIRNLSFVPANRPALLASSDYMFMLSSALQRTASRCEQLIGAVTVWKIVANNQKGKAAVKNSMLVRHIAGLVKHYSMATEVKEQDELWNVLMTVYRILQA